MGSLNADGSIKLLTENRRTIRHQGNFLTETDAPTDTKTATISNSGVIRRQNVALQGVAWQQGGTAATSGLPGTPGTQTPGFADNTIERAKHTANGLEAGNLQHYVTRKIDGNHVSVSDRQAILGQHAAIASGLAGGDAIGPMQIITERKIFFNADDRGKGLTDTFDDWTIFDSTGKAVGADAGTTDTDKTANEGLLDKPEEC